MRLPSIKTLSRVFEDPKIARKILEMSREQLEMHPVGAARVAQCSLRLRLLGSCSVGAARVAECYNPPATVDLRMSILNSLESGFHGVESLKSRDHDFADYLNTGDTYAETIIYWRGSYRVQSVGDFVERVREFREDC